MAVAGAVDTVLGKPPSSAVAKLPGVCTDRVGVPLALLCRETKTIKLKPEKWSGRVCAVIVSSFKVTKLTCRVLILAWYIGLSWNSELALLKG